MKRGDGRRGRQGFSVVELLVVVSIMAMLATPSLVSLAFRRGQDFTKEVYDLQGMLALARTTAMAKNTFVWAGLGHGLVNGQESLMIVAYSSQNGLNDTATVGNLAPIMKRQILPGVAMKQVSTTLAGLAVAATDLSQTTSNWSLPLQNVGGTPITVDQAILFSPTGEAFVTASPLSYIQIGLQPLNGTLADGKNLAALQISGITSQTQVFRN